jgi:adenosylcobinamide-GDP ribazoletransferase
MKREWTLFLVALQFLTRLPVPVAPDLPADALAESGRYFPIVGAIVGGGAVAVDLLIGSRADRNVSIALILVYLVLVTGGLHEDALADAADGFGGGGTSHRVLAIMRDSHIGSFGALAIGCSLLARFAFLTSVPAARLHGVLISGQVLGRWATVPLARWLPPSRPEDGQGARMAQKTSTTALVIASVLAAVIVTLASGVEAVWMTAAACVVAGLTAAYYRRRIGGITGDCLGATCQVAECAVYLSGVVS